MDGKRLLEVIDLTSENSLAHEFLERLSFSKQASEMLFVNTENYQEKSFEIKKGQVFELKYEKNEKDLEIISELKGLKTNVKYFPERVSKPIVTKNSFHFYNPEHNIWLPTFVKDLINMENLEHDEDNTSNGIKTLEEISKALEDHSPFGHIERVGENSYKVILNLLYLGYKTNVNSVNATKNGLSYDKNGNLLIMKNFQAEVLLKYLPIGESTITNIGLRTNFDLSEMLCQNGLVKIVTIHRMANKKGFESTLSSENLYRTGFNYTLRPEESDENISVTEFKEKLRNFNQLLNQSLKVIGGNCKYE